MKKVGMQEMGMTRKLKGGGGAHGKEDEGLLSIRSDLEFRSTHWQTWTRICVRVYGRDRGFGEVVVGTKTMPATSRSYSVCCALSLLVKLVEDTAKRERDLEECMVPIPGETANPEVDGLTFYQSKDTQQGTQNKLFVISLPSFLLVDAEVVRPGNFHGHDYQCTFC
jgi:hypothetical protein